MSKNHARELFKEFNGNKDDYDRYMGTVKYCESVEEETRGEENAKFYARLRRLGRLLNCPNWRERKNEMLTLISKTQTNIKSQYGKYITEEEKEEEMCPQIGRNIEMKEGVNGNYGKN